MFNTNLDLLLYFIVIFCGLILLLCVNDIDRKQPVRFIYRVIFTMLGIFCMYITFVLWCLMSFYGIYISVENINILKPIVYINILAVCFAVIFYIRIIHNSDHCKQIMIGSLFSVVIISLMWVSISTSNNIDILKVIYTLFLKQIECYVFVVVIVMSFIIESLHAIQQFKYNFNIRCLYYCVRKYALYYKNDDL